ncbi:hypothetical protein F5X99DRAFT_429696 [Biscogniauxia marginata]|nr:hypothetical protein F5X99DRAFT_429696 [Biscogniauxia marginata]
MNNLLEDSFEHMATFGFELEFLALFKEYGTLEPWVFKEGEEPNQTRKLFPEEPRYLGYVGSEHELHMKRLHYFGKQIAELLTEAGVAVKYREKGHPNDDRVSGLEANDAKLGHFNEFCYDAYKTATVVSEETMIWTDPAVNGRRMSVRPNIQQGYFWLGFEIVSRAYQYRDFASAEEDLATICKTLRSKYIISVNAGRESETDSSRCATHVHWGLSGQPYELLHIKRLLTLLWVAEEELMGLHATCRQSMSKYAALLRKQTNMAMDKTGALPGWFNNIDTGTSASWREEMEMHVPRLVWESLHRGKPKVQWLWRADGVEDLARLVGESKASRKAAVGITELLPANFKFVGKVRKSRLNTVEFRHMQGSLCPELVVAWIEVTGKIVEICSRYSPEDFKNLLKEVMSCIAEKESTAYDLLGVLGIGEGLRSIFKVHDQKRLFLPPLDGNPHQEARRLLQSHI